ncbi:MAG: FAD-dependent oxidoreductase [Parasporobacterium sp.]|nr:FAD-dependent oxidoreductase [Parasporobacterium sp.]
MSRIHLTIDGIPVTTAENETVLQAALSNGIYIPHICTHPDLPVQANCKLCLVEIDGMEAPVCSCETPVQEGMRVTTKSSALSHWRNLAMELMLAGHPKDCTGCKMYLKCELQAMIQYLGTVHSRMRTVRKETTAINIENPLIIREMERCIQCGRCVRACNEMRKVNVLQYKKQGTETYIGTQEDMPLGEAGCRFCGACVEVCPTGALQDVEDIFRTDLPREQALVPCQAECPAHIDIPAYIRAIQEGDPDKAVGIIREKVPFPLALGLVCNNRCETGCKRKGLNDPLSIRNLKRYAAENDQTHSWKEAYLKRLPDTGKKIAVIGAGACGLTAAYYLNKKGHAVTVFESKQIPGGHMTSGMPAYRISTDAVLSEIQVIEESGVKILCNRHVSNAPEVKKDFDAVLVAIGTSIGKKLLYLPGASDYPQIYSALELLQAQRLGKDIDLGDTVCIVGGGNVAFDAAGTCIRMGKKVQVVCLEKDASQASIEERDAALEEGAILYDSHATEAICGNEGHVTGLKVHKVNGFYFDTQTHALVEDPIPDSTHIISCDSIIFAAGQVTGLTEAFGLQINRFGYPINPTTEKSEFITSVEGVFAAGDVITGTRFLIDAIASGREAASLIDQYLGGDGNIQEVLVARTRDPQIGSLERFFRIPRNELKNRSAQERKCDFDASSIGFGCTEASCESSRCLQCDLRKDIQRVKVWTEYNKKQEESHGL